ncbi:MAG: trypsin-like serine protease [Planctomycetia bacterium]
MNRLALLHRVASVGLAIVLALMVVQTAEAVVVSGGWVTDNNQAPVDPSHETWANVGVRGIGSGVYVGNRWVLTANHVGGGDITLTNGTTYQMAAGSGRQLVNVIGSGSTTPADLFLYQLTADPGLPWVNLATTFSVNDEVLMVGAGRQRGAGTYWAVNSSTNPWTWTPVTSGSYNIAGYDLLTPREMSWGLNVIADSETVSVDGVAVAAMRTDFIAPQFSGDLAGYEGQATAGDSGGPVFRWSGSQWELAGIMVGTSKALNGQPDSVLLGADPLVDFYSETYIADLSAYREQIVTITAVPEPGTVGLAVAAAITAMLGRGLRRRRAG